MSDQITLLIPAYQPDSTLIEVVKKTLALSEKEPREWRILIIDDGSTTAVSQDVFKQLYGTARLDIIRHETNKGKGAALKTGLKHILDHHPSTRVAITADADGQHLPKDIISVANHSLDMQANTIGVRKFDKGIPFRSRFGNLLTKALFKLIHRTNISDTQTGLRAILRENIGELLEIPHNGYEFELTMLIKLTKNKSLQQLSIATIYEPGNPSSHFNPVLDSLKIYAVLLRHIIVTMGVACIDFIIFLSMTTLGNPTSISLIVARSVSVAIIFSIAREFVFKSKGNLFPQLCKFLLLVGANLIFLWKFIELMKSNFNLSPVVAMVIGNLLFFIANFFVQKHFIFNTKKTP